VKKIREVNNLTDKYNQIKKQKGQGTFGARGKQSSGSGILGENNNTSL